MSVLVTTQILGLFVNTLTAADKYSCHNMKKFLQPIEMGLSRKPKSFFKIFHFISAFYVNFLIIWKKYTPYSLRNYWLRKICLLKCLKSPALEHPYIVDVFMGPKHCSNIHGTTFILLRHPPQKDWVGNSLS